MPELTLDADDLREILRRLCDEAGSQKAWARANGVSQPYVSDILNGRREVSDEIAAKLGYERRIGYTWIDQNRP